MLNFSFASYLIEQVTVINLVKKWQLFFIQYLLSKESLLPIWNVRVLDNGIILRFISICISKRKISPLFNNGYEKQCTSLFEWQVLCCKRLSIQISIKSDFCRQALKTEYLHSFINCVCHLFNKIRRCILLLYCTMYLMFN